MAQEINSEFTPSITPGEREREQNLEREKRDVPMEMVTPSADQVFTAAPEQVPQPSVAASEAIAVPKPPDKAPIPGADLIAEVTGVINGGADISTLEKKEPVDILNSVLDSIDQQ
jgi:hypothetical protein